jgi:hypothetical protein
VSSPPGGSRLDVSFNAVAVDHLQVALADLSVEQVVASARPA